MASKRDSNEFTNRLPGTGGDFLDGNDVEGHLKVPVMNTPEPEGGEIAPRFPETGDEDVEGHRLPSGVAPDGEGLYRGGPTTQGEIVMRGPGDNPHGER